MLQEVSDEDGPAAPETQQVQQQAAKRPQKVSAGMLAAVTDQRFRVTMPSRPGRIAAPEVHRYDRILLPATDHQ